MRKDPYCRNSLLKMRYHDMETNGLRQINVRQIMKEHFIVEQNKCTKNTPKPTAILNVFQRI